MRLLHLTDPHLSTLTGETFLKLRGKRRLGFLSWLHKRRFDLQAATLVQVTAAALSEEVDLFVVTGDLVHLGLTSEIAVARIWLMRLRACQNVLLVPGNHDCYQSDAIATTRQYWAEYLHLSPAQSATFPTLVRQGEVSIIGLSSAVPMPWWSAGGVLGVEQLQRLDQLLIESAGTFRCVLLHHPPLVEQAPLRKALKDATALTALLTRHGVELVLHGHLHHNDLRVLAGHTRVMVLAPASSADPRNPACYRVLDIERQGQTWAVKANLKALQAGGRMVSLQRDEWTVPCHSTVA